MSVAFDIKLKDGTYTKVVIRRDGSISFPNYDFEYDLAMEEFGEESSLPLMMLRRWKSEWIFFATSYFGLHRYDLAWLLLDYSRYASKLLRGVSETDADRFDQAIGLAREFLAGRISANEFKKRRSALGIEPPKRRYFVRKKPYKRVKPISGGHYPTVMERMGVTIRTHTNHASRSLLRFVYHTFKETSPASRVRVSALFYDANNDVIDLAVHGYIEVVYRQGQVAGWRFRGGHKKNFSRIDNWCRRYFVHVMEAKRKGLMRPSIEETR